VKCTTHPPLWPALTARSSSSSMAFGSPDDKCATGIRRPLSAHQAGHDLQRSD
jgi:hypothetical protein